MKLFSLNGKPIRFNVVDLEDDELVILEDLIKASGGEMIEDEDSTVIFTSKKAYGKKRYPRAKIYDVQFIFECVLQEKILEAEPFRLNAKIPGDEYHMNHLLFGNCTHQKSIEESKIDSPTNSSASTVAATDGQSQESNDTMFTAKEGSSLAVSPSVDESQMVVIPADLNICTPTLAGGDAPAIAAESHEKRPCNLEYELIVQPKMAALEREARRQAAAKESNAESRQLQRSLRTRTKRNLSAQTEATQERNPSDSENMDVENIRVKEELPQTFSDDCQTPKKMLTIEILSSPENAVSPKPQIPEKNVSTWIETKRKASPKVLSNVVLPSNRLKKVEKSLLPTDSSSKLLNLCYKGLKAVQDAGEPVLSKSGKRRASDEKSSDEAGASKRNGKNERQRLLSGEKNARKSNGRKRDSSEDEEKARKKNSKRRSTHSNENPRGRKKARERGGESSEDEEESSEPLPKPDDPKRKNKTMRKLFNVDKKQSLFDVSDNDSSRSSREKVYPDDSSDFSLTYSSDEETPKKKRFRAIKAESLDSTDRIVISDDSGEEINPERKRKVDHDKPGPSGVRNVNKDFYIDDDDSSYDADNEKTNHLNRLEKAGDWKPIVEPKVENASAVVKSRGQLWRSQLIDKSGDSDSRTRQGPYNASERNTMINYLVRTKCISKAKGLVVWKAMIKDGFLEHRTPQSLQNHFRKSILPHIEQCTHLKEKDKIKFLLLRNENSEK